MRCETRIKPGGHTYFGRYGLHLALRRYAFVSSAAVVFVGLVVQLSTRASQRMGKHGDANKCNLEQRVIVVDFLLPNKVRHDANHGAQIVRQQAHTRRIVGL